MLFKPDKFTLYVEVSELPDWAQVQYTTAHRNQWGGWNTEYHYVWDELVYEAMGKDVEIENYFVSGVLTFNWQGDDPQQIANAAQRVNELFSAPLETYAETEWYAGFKEWADADPEYEYNHTHDDQLDFLAKWRETRLART